MPGIHSPQLNINRRQLLVGFGALTTAATLAGCGGVGSSSPSSEAVSDAQNSPILTPSPEFGAGSYIFSPYNNERSNKVLTELAEQGRYFYSEVSGVENGASIAFLNGGWGALVKENHLGLDHYAIVTLPHVVLEQEYYLGISMHIPGVGVLDVSDPYWVYTKSDPQKTNSRDFAHAYMSLNGAVKDVIEQQILASNITPIKPLNTLPDVGETLAILVAEDSRYNLEQVAFRQIEYTELNQDYVGLGVRHINPSVASRNCLNSSGKPALQVGFTETGQPYYTGGAYGSLMLLLNDSEYASKSGDTTICSPNLVLKPYFPLSEME